MEPQKPVKLERSDSFEAKPRPVFTEGMFRAQMEASWKAYVRDFHKMRRQRAHEEEEEKVMVEVKVEPSEEEKVKVKVEPPEEEKVKVKLKFKASEEKSDEKPNNGGWGGKETDETETRPPTDMV